MKKKEDCRTIIIPWMIGLLHFAKALCDIHATIKLMPLSNYKKLGLCDPMWGWFSGSHYSMEEIPSNRACNDWYGKGAAEV